MCVNALSLPQIEPSKRKVGVAANLPQANGGPAKRLVSKPELEVPSNLSQMQLRGHARSSSLPSVANEMPPPPDITENILLGPLFHPYLSPVVLRKELETHLRLGNELLSNDFMTESPVLFWNMVSNMILTYHLIASSPYVCELQRTNISFLKVDI